MQKVTIVLCKQKLLCDNYQYEIVSINSIKSINNGRSMSIRKDDYASKGRH